MTRFGITLSSIALSLTFQASAASAAETCGDGIDNNSDGLLDEGCYPAGVTGICESPLDCSRAGAVGPKTGQLVFNVMPDVAPTVAYGPSLVFQRFYMSKYDPGYADFGASAATDFQAPMGYRWHHNFMSWLVLDTAPSPDEVALHAVTGQDILFTYDSNSGGYDYYTPQAGYHFDYLRQNTTSSLWELRTLSGIVYEYDENVGSTYKLTKIKDGVGKYIELDYNNDGQVEWVTSASTAKKLKLEYQGSGSELLQYVKYYTDTGSDTLRLTVEFTYSSGKLDLVKLDSTTVLDHSYDSDGYLTKIEDGETSAKTIATFAYLVESGNTAGKVARIETPEGDVGYTYGVDCSGGAGSDDTIIAFHRASTTSCDADGDCSTGEYCGGETDPGSANTGTCFKAERCLTMSSPNEDLIDAVSATSCSTCANNEDYVFDTGTGDKIELDGMMSADDVWTTYEYNSDGMVTKMVEGDTNSDPSSVPAGARVTYFIYGDSDFPGLVTEVRRLSELKPSGTCNAGTTTDCKRTIYTYTSGGLVDTVNEKGFTYNNADSVVSYDFTTDYDYNGNGQITDYKGPRPNTDDNVEFTYETTRGLSEGYLKEVKRKWDAQTYVTTGYAEYDYWGNAGRIDDDNDKSMCFTFHGDYSRLTERRQVMNGTHQDCTATAGSEDLVTSYTYDTYRRLTQITKPKTDCVDYTYDGEGRLTEVEIVDSSGGAGACDNLQWSIEHTYSIEGLRTKTEWKDRVGTVRKRQEWTFYTDRRIETVINPVSTSYHKKWYYDDDGIPAKVEFEDYSTTDAKTEWDADDLNRTTKIRQYTTSTSNEEWTLTQAAQHLGLPTDVSDEASHDIDMVWDDMRRKVKQETEEAGITLFIYDEAGNLEEKVEADGLTDEQTTTYTYDTLNRLAEVDTGDADCHTSGGAEIQYKYDGLGSESCPSGSTCNLLSGRLAYAKTLMWCDDAENDDMFDQLTFYSYDEAGRIVEHTVEDDGGRKGQVEYEYDENSNIERINYPAGSSSGAVYHYQWGYNMTDDEPYKLKRDSTEILYQIRWLPLRFLDIYFSQARISTYPEWFNRGENLALRNEQIEVKSYLTTVLKVDHDEDLRGRYTARDLTGGTASQRDSFYLYDELNRVTCRRTTSGSTCPTSGSTLGMNISYNTSGDRSGIYLRNGVYADQQFDVAYVSSTSDELDYYKYTGTADQIEYAHDTLGRRTSDDDQKFGGSPDKDKRVYTYDGRNNLVTVSGEYYTGSTWHTYTVSYAYDERNRMIFKSFVDEDDETCGPQNDEPCEAQWFFYWDKFDRIVQAKHTPDLDDSDTYSIFQWYWLDDVPIAYYQIDYPNAVTSRRMIWSDEQGRPLTAWSWPSSGDSTQVWEVDPGLFGWDEVTVGSDVYQPLRFPGQLYDEDTESWADDSGATLKRPGVCYNRYRSYDSFTGAFIQADPLHHVSGSAYGYAAQSPVQSSDPTGLLPKLVCRREQAQTLDEGGGTTGTNSSTEEETCSIVWDDDEYTPYDPPIPWGGAGGGFGGGGASSSWDPPKPKDPPEPEDCHGEYSGKECGDCCHRNWERDYDWCKERYRDWGRRAACRRAATDLMAACIRFCPGDPVIELAAPNAGQSSPLGQLGVVR